jgi:hypothetical protein
MADNLLVPSLPKTSLVQEIDKLFASLGYAEHLSLKNHNLRIFSFCRHLMLKKKIDFDTSLLYALCVFHHPMVVRRHGAGKNYQAKSLELLKRACTSYAVSKEQLEHLTRALQLWRKIGSVEKISPLAEIFREAILIENSRGIFNFGLAPLQVLGVFRHYAVFDIDKVLVGGWMRILRLLPFGHPKN